MFRASQSSRFESSTESNRNSSIGTRSSISTPYSRVGTVVGDRYKFVCAIVENRMREVGFAVLNLTRPEIELSHFTDNYTYLNVLTKLTIYYPQEILLPKTAGAASELQNIISTKYPGCKIVPVIRKYFDETQGSKYISMLSVPGSTITAEVHEKYLCQAALAALIKYAEFTQKVSFAANSLKISFVGKEGTMMIDGTTLWNLEVLCDSRSGDSKMSLYGSMNYTLTNAGARLLRVNLCQPPCEEHTINTRLDCVDELARKEKTYFAICAALKDLPNIDRILSCLVTIEKEKTAESSYQRNLATIIHLKHLIERIPKLVHSLTECENGLFVAMRRNFMDGRIRNIHRLILSIVNIDVQPKKQTLEMKLQQCCSIKEGINGLLDVARKTFKETLEDISSLVDIYKERYKLPGIQLQHSAKRGYFMRVATPAPPLPRQFIQVLEQKKFAKFSSEELISLNQRQKDSMAEILQLSNRMLGELFHELRSNIAALYNINDTISLLDMISSFVTFISLTPECCRPEFSKQPKLQIRKGRHPILSILGEKPFIPNDTNCSENFNFHLITGANMSGKSTYIKQIALLTVMAQVGCFVPADYCCIRATDHLFTRIGTSDSVEENASSFMLEMREMAYILQNKTDKSLIIIDELGRGTSFNDACSLAWSCCESLLTEKTCFTFFVTHFSQLIQLEKLYSNVKLGFLDTQQNDSQIIYKHHLRSGIDSSEHYGITLAKVKAGFPLRVIEYANEITGKLQELQNSEKMATSSRDSNWLETCTQVASELRGLKFSSLDDTDIRNFLIDAQLRLRVARGLID